jgi:hypothetical protein
LPQAARAATAIREANRSDLFMNVLKLRVEQLPVILEARCSSRASSSSQTRKFTSEPLSTRDTQGG